MALRDDFIQAAANMENALTNVLNATPGITSNTDELERLLKLIIKKEIVLEFLLEEFPGPICTVETNSFFNITPIAIPATDTEGPAAPYPSPILVSGLTGAVQKVTVTFNDLSHTWPADIVAMLVGPNGQDTILMATADGGLDINNVDLTFDDDAANPLPSGQITSGTYQPTNNGVFATFPPPANQPSGNTNLSVYNGTDPNGVWNLFIIDQFGGDVGTMASGWTLTITSCEDGASNSSGGNDVVQPVLAQQKGQEPMVKELTEEEKAKRQKKLEMIKKLKEAKEE